MSAKPSQKLSNSATDSEHTEDAVDPRVQVSITPKSQIVYTFKHLLNRCVCLFIYIPHDHAFII